MIVPAADSNMSFTVRKALVDALFASFGILVLGAAAGLCLAVIAHLSHNDGALVFLSLLIVVISGLRMTILESYRRRRSAITDLGTLRRWELIYLGGAVATLGTFGMLAAVSETLYPSSIFTYGCLVTVMGATISVGARNYASRRVVVAATCASCVPAAGAALASAYYHENYPAYILTLLIVFIASMAVYLGFYLRSRFIEAVVNARCSQINSGRFNVAISTMPNGLLMVDGSNRVTVLNSRAADKLRIAHDFDGPLEEALSSNLALSSAERVRQQLEVVRGAGAAAPRREIRVRTIDGRWLHCFFNTIATGATSADAGTAGTAVIILQDVTDKVEDETALLNAACYDKLSGLANRTHWETLADSSVSRLPPDGLVAMCILDVDKFKLINDTLGHHVGDEVIAGVARNLTECGDVRLIPGRMGGDEFVILVPGLTSRDEVGPLFDRIFSAISRTYTVSGHNVEVRCSGGVIVRSRDEFDRQADMNRADMALYKVKRNPNQSWMLFDSDLEGEYQETSRIKHDLRSAIDDGSLQVVYQPIFDTDGSRMLSTEALCRWNHSDVGAISPAQFISMAEEIGVIGRLTSYVLRTACRDCKAWGADVPVAVNLSALDLARDDIVGMIESALREFDLPPSRLCVEVTESVFVKDFAKTAATLQTLRGMGVKTSLDDFGTGYSSLSYLSQLPLNRVKIDRNFVIGICEDAKAQRLFRGVVSLAKELEFEVVVEGIEGQDELSFVRSVPGVDMIQGFVYSTPYTADDMKVGFAARHLSGRTPRAQNLRLVGP